MQILVNLFWPSVWLWLLSNGHLEFALWMLFWNDRDRDLVNQLSINQAQVSTVLQVVSCYRNWPEGDSIYLACSYPSHPASGDFWSCSCVSFRDTHNLWAQVSTWATQLPIVPHTATEPATNTRCDLWWKGETCESQRQWRASHRNGEWQEWPWYVVTFFVNVWWEIFQTIG